MAIRIVRLGTPRDPAEGTRLGTVRRPAPSAPLVAYAHSKPFTTQRWNTYAGRYRREMAQPAARRLISLLAALSSEADFSVGCYCEDESRCHRSLLRELLVAAGAVIE